MIRIQIIERIGADLFAALKEAMRSGDLRTFSLEKRGRKVVHKAYPGWINWSHGQGVISGEILSPHKPGAEWQILSALVGRLAHKYPDRVESIHVQLAPPVPVADGRRGKKRKRPRG